MSDHHAPRLPIAPRSEVLWFGGEMERKLQNHAWKSHWSGLTQKNLRRQLLAKVKELVRAVEGKGPKAKAQQIKHATNVANFAMMIADNAAREEGEDE